MKDVNQFSALFIDHHYVLWPNLIPGVMYTSCCDVGARDGRFSDRTYLLAFRDHTRRVLPTTHHFTAFSPLLQQTYLSEGRERARPLTTEGEEALFLLFTFCVELLNILWTGLFEGSEQRNRESGENTFSSCVYVMCGMYTSWRLCEQDPENNTCNSSVKIICERTKLCHIWYFLYVLTTVPSQHRCFLECSQYPWTCYDRKK